MSGHILSIIGQIIKHYASIIHTLCAKYTLPTGIDILEVVVKILSESGVIILSNYVMNAMMK